MRFVDDPGIGSVESYLFQQLEIVEQGAGAAAHRGIVLHLAGHQDPALSGTGADLTGQVTLEVELAGPQGHDPLTQARGLDQRGLIELLVLEQRLQVAAGAGIEVHAAAVEHQRQGRCIQCAEPVGAQKAVFNSPHGDPMTAGASLEISRLTRRPDQQLAAFGRDVRDQRRVVFAEVQATPAAAEKAADVVLFVTLDPQHREVPGKLTIPGLLACQLMGYGQGVGGLAGQRVDVAAVAHVGRCHQLLQVRSRLAPGNRHAVVGQAPAGIERQAKTGHRHTLDQGLQSRLAGADVDPPGPSGQRGPGHRARFQGDAALGGRRQQATGFLAADAVRVNAYAHLGIGVFRQGCVEHAHIVGLTQTATGDRVVAGRLVHHQHQWTLAAQGVIRVEVRGVVVLADATAAHQGDQLSRAVQFRSGQAGGILEDVFQQRRAVGQVVDAHRIDHQGHGCVALDAQR